MRKSVSALACLAVILSTVLIVPSAIIAGPLPAATAARPAGDDLTVEKVLCWGYGWRGWGLYPGWFRPACANAWAAPGYVVPAPAYVPGYVAPAVPAAAPCWVPPGRNGQPGYWAAC
jgi:hypothetical protein